MFEKLVNYYNTFANLHNIGLKSHKIVTISIGFQGFGTGFVINRFCYKIGIFGVSLKKLNAYAKSPTY